LTPLRTEKGREDMSKPAANDLDEEEALREVIDALRADNGKLLRLLIAGFVSDGRPEHKELTEVLAHYPNLRNWLGTGELKPDQEGRGGEHLSIQARIHERYGSTANTPLIATFVPDDRIASENRQRLKSADKPAPGTSRAVASRIGPGG
jgi:hypothetical protein